jgi:ABC-2 type transport system ATP-binding protein
MSYMNTAISVSGLTKSFGWARALDGLDLSLRTSEVHGFLGPNGAGKTTTIRILLGLLRPDQGQARLLDGDPWRDATALHRRLAYVSGDVSLWPSLSGGEIIDLLYLIQHGLDGRAAVERLALLRQGTPDSHRRSPETDEQYAFVLAWRNEAQHER